MVEDVLGLGGALEGLNDRDEEAERLNDLARGLVNSLFVLLRMAGMHDLNNDALLRPMDTLSEVVGALHQVHGEDIVLRLADGNFFVNKRMVRLDYGTFQNVRYLERIFDFLNINEVTFKDGFDRQTMRQFAAAALAIIRVGHGYIEDQQLGDIRLRKMKVGEIDELRRDNDPRNRILGTYASGLLTMRQFIADLRHGRSPRHTLLKRLCLELIDLDPRYHSLLLALVHLEAYKGSLFCHIMNTALLSLVFGQRLGLGRRQLVDLGLAAFHHDLGWALLVDDRLAEADDGFGLMMSTINAVRDGDHDDLHRLRTQVARSLSRFGGFNEMVINRLIVAFECQVPGGHASRDLYFSDVDAAFMTEVVRIASAYDELTTITHDRPALLPDQAMRHIQDPTRDEFDPKLARLFAQSIGMYPVGTVVELDTSEVGLVINLPSNPINDHRPQVKILVDRNGRPLADGPVVDLDARFQGGERYMRTVERTLDGKAFGVSITRFFFGIGAA